MTETTGASAGARRKSATKGVKVERIFTTAGVHPYDDL
jgi:ribonucleoside-diphosphate reductase alpha chain